MVFWLCTIRIFKVNRLLIFVCFSTLFSLFKCRFLQSVLFRLNSLAVPFCSTVCKYTHMHLIIIVAEQRNEEWRIKNKWNNMIIVVIIQKLWTCLEYGEVLILNDELVCWKQCIVSFISSFSLSYLYFSLFFLVVNLIIVNQIKVEIRAIRRFCYELNFNESNNFVCFEKFWNVSIKMS